MSEIAEVTLSANRVRVSLKCIAWLASMSLGGVDLGKMNLQLMANEENQDRAQCGKNEASRVISFVCRARKHVANAAADDRSDDAEHGCPEHVIGTCITDFARTPEIRPIRIYQIK